MFVRVPRFALASLLVASTFAAAQLAASQPEPSSGWTAKHLATAPHYMVAAAHPLAVEAGLEVLGRGGNAASLKAMGHEVRAIDMTSGLHAVRRAAAGWEGGADSRRDGMARGR